jgi:hypothetical protein
VHEHVSIEYLRHLAHYAPNQRDRRHFALVADLIEAQQAEIERLRAALTAIQSEADIFGDAGCACSDVYLLTLNRVWKMAVYALPVVGGPT